MAQPVFNKVTLCGVGLMGGSLGLALQKEGLAGEVWGYGRNPDRIETARLKGVVTHASTDLAKAAKNADLVVVCLPVHLIPRVALDFSEKVPKTAVLTDVGSCKAEIVAAVEEGLPEEGPVFVGSHPMCGSERSGFETARADLYVGSTCAITPTLTTPQSAINAVTQLWKGVGGEILHLEPREHDRLVARTSHLPRTVAAALCHTLDREMDADNRDRMVATGFLSATRTAASEEDVWESILASNRENLVDAIGDLQGCLHELHDILSSGDDARLRTWLEQGKLIRRRVDPSNRPDGTI